MIFYFSATGNSKYVAECIRTEGETLISIADATDKKEYNYHVSDERVGVVSPTYDWTLPSIVSEFLEKLTLNFDEKPDSTGCGDIMTDNTSCTGPVFHTRGTHELELFDEKAPVLDVRTMVGSSNYRTDFYIGKNSSYDMKLLCKNLF